MIFDRLAPGTWMVREGQAAIFLSTCHAGDGTCRWMLFPQHNQDSGVWEWVAQHGDNREAVLVLGRSGEVTPSAMFDQIEGWVARCHEYEDR